MERRKSHRTPVILQARYAATNPTPAGGGKTITRDLSRSGTALVLEHRMAPNTVVEVELEIPGLEQAVKAKGEVMWQRNIPGGLAPTFLTGVQFLRMDSPLQDQIDHFVASQLKQHSQSADEKAVDSFDRSIRTVQQPWPIQMATLRTTHARVAAIGAYLPPTRLTNEDLVKKAGVSFLPILLQRALGASERRAAPPEDTAADLMVRAAKNILEQAHCDPKDLDRIICSSDPGDAVAPATAVAVQAKLAATCPAYDVTMSCAGWMCGIDQGLRALATGEKKILVLASAMATKTTFHDLKHRAIFGDGAGGLLLEAVPEGQLMATALWSDGRFYSKIFLPGHWAHHPADIPEEYKGSFYMDPNQNTFFDQLTRVLPPFFKRLLLEADVAAEDVDHFFLHQPSQPLFEHSLKLLRMIPRSKVYDAFSKYGNIVAAEMPVMLNEAVQNGQVKRGDLACMVTYGAGFTMAGMVFQY